MQTLTVINKMLATLGQKPLNSLTDSHRLLPAALDALDEANRSIQSQGWWFNLEVASLTKNAIDNCIYLPNDALNVRTPYNYVVKRGNRLFNLTTGGFGFDADLSVTLIRNIPFENLPDVAASYIADSAIVAFQTAYDADVVKTKLLLETLNTSKRLFMAEHTRSRQTNLLDNNLRLSTLKAKMRLA